MYVDNASHEGVIKFLLHNDLKSSWRSIGYLNFVCTLNLSPTSYYVRNGGSDSNAFRIVLLVVSDVVNNRLFLKWQTFIYREVDQGAKIVVEVDGDNVRVTNLKVSCTILFILYSLLKMESERRVRKGVANEWWTVLLTNHETVIQHPRPTATLTLIFFNSDSYEMFFFCSSVLKGYLL